MTICYDQAYNDIGVVIVTKWRLYLFYLEPYLSALGSVISEIVHGSFFPPIVALMFVKFKDILLER